MKTAPTMQAVITELAAQHDVALTETGAHLHLDMMGYDQLRIERLSNGCIRVAHFFECQGLLFPEPDVCFFVDAHGGWAPINITQSMTGYSAYADLSKDGSATVRYNCRRQADLADFCETWAQNLRDQGWLDHAVKHQLSGNHLFALGQIVATPGALDALEQAGQTPSEFINRHVTGNWGDLNEHDRTENERALKQGSRLFSAYHLSDGTKIWLITEWDRSVTTLLLPADY